MKVRLYSPIGRVTGYGRAGVELARTLLELGVDLQISASANPGEATQAVPDCVAACIVPERDLARPDVTIVHTPPQDCGRLLEKLLLTTDRALLGKVVAYTTWETHEAPDAIGRGLSTFDQVWVPSAATLHAFAGIEVGHTTLSEKIRVVPHAFDPATYAARRAPVRDDEPYRFYYVGAWTQRKNPAGVIRAYLHAFRRDDPVELVLHLGPAPQEEIALAIGSAGIDATRQAKIRVGLRYVSDEELLELHRANDCFVTASRGEAWNLGAFDAMLAGNHVIAPAGHGSDDFLDMTSAVTYPSRMTIATVDAALAKQVGGSFQVIVKSPQGVDGTVRWNDPDLLELAYCMRDAVGRRRRLIGPDPRDRFGYPAVARLVHHCLKELTEP